MKSEEIGKVLIFIMLLPLLGILRGNEGVVLLAIILLGIMILTVISYQTARMVGFEIAFFIPQIVILLIGILYIVTVRETLDAFESLGLFWMSVLTIYAQLFSIPTYMILRKKIF